MSSGKKTTNKSHHRAREVSAGEQERRKKVRGMVKIRNSISVNSDALDPDEVVNGNILDLTLTGLGIATNIKLPLGKFVKVSINGRDYNWEVTGRVVWCAPLPVSGHVLKKDGPLVWRIGLDLSSQDEAQEKIMENMVALFCDKK